MHSRYSKIDIWIAVVFEIILITTAISNISSKQWKNLFLISAAIILVVFPFIIVSVAKAKNIMLPSSFELFSILFVLFTLYLGETKNFYEIFWWWDLALHAIASGYFVIVALYLIRGIIIKEQKITISRYSILILILAFSFSITLSTLWEIFEFVGDYLFNTEMTKGGLKDTSSDLIAAIVAAFITSIICYNYRRKLIR